MWHYVAPLEDMAFVVRDVLRAPEAWSSLPAFADVDLELAHAILEQGGRFCSDILAPANAAGDREGCRLENAQVRTPAAFPLAYKQFVEQGWPALACAPQWGGQGLPQLLNSAIYEMLAASNHAWVMYPGLQHGAYESIKTHASQALCERYLPDIVSGATLATMCLSEPQAGSDLSLISTRANAASDATDGAVDVTGSKIWISGGDHDLTDNIIHLVLARLPDAPPGNKGLSLILVPKQLPDGSRNRVFVDGIEQKMGIKGSATCAMRFEQARGWIIGEPNRGLSAMFVMMNAARLHVALQGLGHLEAATQNALRYAHERPQMRTLQRSPEQRLHAADPIARHPAIRHKLLRLQALVEGGRVIAYHAAMLLDQHEHHPDPDQRVEAASQAALLTPVLKAFLTTLGHQGADDALQVWGGYGYTHEFGIEQTVRDSRVSMIYEGTNEIQAIDLLTRKVLADDGAVLNRLLDIMCADADHFDDRLVNQQIQHRVAQQIEHLRLASERIRSQSALSGESQPEYALTLADDYLVLFGYTLMAWAWSRSLNALGSQQIGPAFRDAKAQVCHYGMEWVLAESLPAIARINAADPTLPQLKNLP